jgi:hypothetical protein
MMDVVGKLAGVVAKLRGRYLLFPLLPILSCGVVAAVAGAAVADATKPPAPTPPPSEVKRRVLGTIVAPGALEVESDSGTWTPAANGAPVLDNTSLRNGDGPKAMVALGTHGVIGVRENSRLRIGGADRQGLPVSLEGESELSFRLPETTALSFLTVSAEVMAPTERSSPDTGQIGWIQGTIRQHENKTTVTLVEGTLRVRNRGAAEFTTLTSGEEAVITAAASTPRIAAMTAAPSRSKLGWLGLGTTTGMVVAGGVLIGGGLGGAAAAGAFDGGSSSGAQGDGEPPPPASPFRP